MGIFNSNDYQRGNEDGRKDAEAGRDKDYRRAGMTPKFAIYGEKVLDTYVDGYDDGYNTEKRNEIYRGD